LQTIELFRKIVYRVVIDPDKVEVLLRKQNLRPTALLAKFADSLTEPCGRLSGRKISVGTAKRPKFVELLTSWFFFPA
jgi:hypothetical protein